MASSTEFVEYILEQLAAAEVTARKMFGEYALYCEGKVVGGIYDNRLLVKITAQFAESFPEAIPYEGAKPMLWLEEVDDSAELCRVVLATAAALPMPKPKAAKKTRTK